MKWHEITIYTTEVATEMVADILHGLGSGGVSIEESGTLNKHRDTSLGQWYELPLNDIPEGEAVVKGYFANVDAVQVKVLLAQIEQSIYRLPEFGIAIGKVQMTHQEVDEADWANEWKQYYKPLRITDRLVIKPTWEPYEASATDIVISLDPGMAFGTGTHETTALCLRTIEQVLRPGDRVIDIGTGSGILAIAAAKLGAQHVLAIDVDPVAVASAQENVALNALEGQITVREGDLLHAADVTDGVQLVIANILAEIIVTFVSDVHDVLADGGTYIASGIIKKKEADVIASLEKAGFTIERSFYENDWVALVARKL